MARPVAMDEATIERMQAWGASEEVLAQAREQLAEDAGLQVAEVWPENWRTWVFFLQVNSLWARAGMDGRRCALDWPAVEVVARGLGLVGRRWRQLVEDLLLIQDEVLQVDAARAERSAQ